MINELRGAETILIADDEPVVLSLACKILKLYGYQVVVAENGGVALELYKKAGSVDLLLTDVIMPVMSGPELAHALKQTEDNLRCIFMSGYDHEHIRQRGIEDPGCDFLRKPFTAEALLRKVRGTLDAKN